MRCIFLKCVLSCVDVKLSERRIVLYIWEDLTVSQCALRSQMEESNFFKKALSSFCLINLQFAANPKADCHADSLRLSKEWSQIT